LVYNRSWLTTGVGLQQELVYNSLPVMCR
jgi:hypothetical protein